ncbi:polysaccharide transporter, PST family [Halogranum amylolyticum]|uniref:Polysaccharide transporter, PST family n=1 Tax=Halogranum amylolyticum TaxID=660520 RepID=A0A1H8MPQ5_9EURY|nr:polysaccharide transporter, PST family [Halogranum amylolyticum]
MFDKLRRVLRTIYQRALPDGTLTNQTVKSGVWSAGMKIGMRGLQVLSLVVLARILGPREFGLMGIALITYTSLRRFSELGIKSALIQRSEANVDTFLDTAWTLQLVRGLVLALLLVTSAPAVAWFFDEPRVTLILRVIAVSPIVAGVINPSIVYFQKDLDMHKQFLFGMSASVAKFVASVAIAIIYESVWALVAGFIIADFARLVASYALHDYRPGLNIDRAQVRELIGYGKWITASKAISFILTSGDDALVGRLVSTTGLGYYQLGYQLAKMPTMEMSRSVSTVVFPLYSKLQDDTEMLGNAVLRSVRLLSFLAFPATVGIILTARSFIPAVLGSQWNPIVPVMQIVAVYGGFAALTSVFADVWNAVGRPDLNPKINGIRLLFSGILIIPATIRYDLVGAAGAIVGVYLLTVPLQIHVVVRCLDIRHRALLKELAYPALASGIMGLVLLGVRQTVSIELVVVKFALLVVVGAAVYVSAALLLDSHSQWDIRTEFDSIIRSL